MTIEMDKDIKQLIAQIENDPDHVWFEGATEEEMDALEATLGLKLPPSFREFLTISNGALLFQNEIIYGTCDDLEENGLRQSVLTVRDALRQSSHLPANLVPFHQGGVYNCFDTSGPVRDEYQISSFSADGNLTSTPHKSFTNWFYDLLSQYHQTLA